MFVCVEVLQTYTVNPMLGHVKELQSDFGDLDHTFTGHRLSPLERLEPCIVRTLSLLAMNRF